MKCGVLFKRKKNKKWIWLIIDRKTRQILAFHVGGRTIVDARKLWKKLPEIVRKNCFVYTDYLAAYHAVMKAQHKASGKDAGQTNHIERLNNTFRQRISRLVRKALSFSKSLSNHIGAIKNFICDYNLQKNIA